MKIKTFLLNLFFLSVFLHLSISAQTNDAALKTFDKDGLSFQYPAQWELTDQSTEEMQQLKLSFQNNAAIIYLNSPRELITEQEQLYHAQEKITYRFVKNIKNIFSGSIHTIPLEEENACANLGGRNRRINFIYGGYRNQPATADVFSSVIESRYINLVFIRNNKDKSTADMVWEKLFDTLKVAASKDKKKQPAEFYDVTSEGIVNGRATKLPAPMFLNIRSIGPVNIEIRVQVLIDEKGKVITARAPQIRNLDPRILAAAEQAAKEARFQPALICGEPVGISGIIIYRFIR